MVGFGSSLRMGRRTGWENAYLDYETLKLLLSQIEAVYEECEQQQRTNSTDGFCFLNTTNTAVSGFAAASDSERNTTTNNNTTSNYKSADYRDQLFLESDSDIAFASELELDDDASDDTFYRADRDVDIDRALADDSLDYNYAGMNITIWEQQGLGQHHLHVDPYSYANSGGGGGERGESLSASDLRGLLPITTPAKTSTHHQVNHTLQQTPSAFSVTAYGTSNYQSGGMYSSSSDENDDYYANDSDYDAKCGPWSTGRKKKSGNKSSGKNKKGSGSSTNKKKKKSIHRGGMKQKLRPRHHHKLSSTGIIAPDAFIIEKENTGNENDGNNDEEFGGGNSYYYYNFDENDNRGITDDGDGGGGTDFEGTNEGSSLLRDSNPLATPTHKGENYDTTRRFFSFPTPRRDSVNNESIGNEGSHTTVASMKKDKTATSNIDDERRKIEYERERRRARKQRRRRRVIHQRKEREKKVPPHIREAHAKARAITERFLGLLRAEVEKVTLFAQARLGELADTSGSLRFLSSDESSMATVSAKTMTATSSTAAYAYPLSDGGIHPSASSSSDEGAGGYHHHNYRGGFPWSDSSSDEGCSKDNGNGQKKKTKNNRTKTSSLKAAAESLSSAHNNLRPAFSETQEQFEATTRKIAHFQEVRRQRSIFQRNDYIVGEDLLLISAVDEADAFSAVAVELLHILKYICVNLITVRKICKKHDRLLMNRMLGGYYHRKRTTRSEEDTTLGGLIAHVAGDIYEAHPDLIGLANNGKLIGIYDNKIQQLANSRTVKVVSSCLALALSEYEVSRWRAAALAKLNPALKKEKKSALSHDQGSSKWPFNLSTDNCLKNSSQQQHEETLALLHDHDMYAGSDDEHGAASTASSLSLSRLRYAVLSIAALREASRIKTNPFSSYLSRYLLSFTGQATKGEGLDGCSRNTLDVLLAFNPDAALLLDTSAIYEGLKCGHWRKASIASVMTSSLAVALTLPSSGQSSAPLKLSQRELHEKERIVSNALGILPPKSEGLQSKSPLEDAGLPPSVFLRISRFTDLPPYILRANRFSLFLYSANYFVSHPTSVAITLEAGDSIAFSALIIGAPILSAIFAAMIHCHFLSEYTTRQQVNNKNITLFRNLLIASCLSAIVSNIVQIYGIESASVSISILGRFLMGFAASEIVHRQFVVCFIPDSLLVAESARLIQFQVSGQILGLLIGWSTRSPTTKSEFNPGYVTKTYIDAGKGRSLIGDEIHTDHPTLEPSVSKQAGDPNKSIGIPTTKYPSVLLPVLLEESSKPSIFPSGIPFTLATESSFPDRISTLNNVNNKSSELRRLAAANWFIVALWLCYLIYILFGCKVSYTHNNLSKKGTEGESLASGDGCSNEDEVESSDSSTSDPGTGLLRQKSSKLRGLSVDGNYNEIEPMLPSEILKDDRADAKPKKPLRRIRTFTKRFRKLMLYSIAIPVCLVLTICTAFAQEVLFSSCPLITKLYFHWRGSVTGLFLASLSITILPLDYACERITRRYEERLTVQRSILFLGLGFLLMLNWGSLFALIPNMQNLFKQDRSDRHHQYDWMLGVAQYIVGFIITFTTLRSLAVASRSLLSKVSPPNLQTIVINLGTIVTFVSLFSRLFANFFIASVVLSEREINIDILNSLLIPILIATLVIHHLVRKHYFFLM